MKGLHDFEKLSESEILNELDDDSESITRDKISTLWEKVKYVEDSGSINDFIDKDYQIGICD